MFFFSPDVMSNVLLWHDKVSGIFEGYRMVFARISEHTSSGFNFASTNSDLFCHASTERAHEKIQIAIASWNLSFIKKLFCAK